MDKYSFVTEHAAVKKRSRYPLVIIGLLLVLCGAAISQLSSLKFDASADTLIAEGDPELAYYRRTAKTFAEQPFLVLTYTPLAGELISTQNIEQLEEIVNELKAVEGIKNVQSVLDAPLLRSPPIPLLELQKGFRTLTSNDVDYALARQELVTSPLFSELLISKDGQTTAIRIDLKSNPILQEKLNERSQLVATSLDITHLDHDIEQLTLADKAATQTTIDAVRAIRDRYTDTSILYLGGVPMVAADMVEFVKSDMATFGLAIVLLLATALYLFFRRLRWVLVPLGTTGVTLLLMMGLLAALGQPVTAISANMVALLAIITISFTIHLAERYRELYTSYKDDPVPCSLSYAAMRSKLAPCLYTAITTMMAFASLTTSDIVPVVDFGWMMCVGIAISLLVTYSFFASVLVWLPKNESVRSITHTPKLTAWFARMSTDYSRRVLAVALIAVVMAGFGMRQLEIGNRLVDYFRADTEIHRGLDFIDQQLGGTIPLDIILKFEPYQQLAAEAGDDSFDTFADEEADTYPERFWFTPEKLQVIDQLQTFLETKDALGKSISLANMERLARTFNDGEPLSYAELTTVMGILPESVRQSLITPYASPRTGELRISSRLHETGPVHDLQDLIASIEAFAVQKLHISAADIHVTGVAVLFSDMLEQLVQSQLSTVAFVILATFAMFALLLRSITLAVIGLAPNLLAAIMILAFMGYAGIPLDVMTITIAAVVIGIGVDDAIHYLHRFKEEVDAGHSTITAVQITHASTGKALYLTTLVVVIGFSVLLFSRFVPTLYFGWLTALAMAFALTANLCLLPALLVKIYRCKPVAESISKSIAQPST